MNFVNRNSYKYNKNYFYSYNEPYLNIKSNIHMSEVPISTNVGYIELYVFTERGDVPVKDAQVTIYARQGEINATPVITATTEINPITIGLPIAHPQGTLIKGPEYYFTTYNMIIEKEGYFSIVVLNIRLFPGVTAKFNYNLNPVTRGAPEEQRTYSIPPHPRDIVDY